MTVFQQGGKTIGLLSLVKHGYKVPEFVSLPISTCHETAVLEIVNTTFKHQVYFAVRSSAATEDGAYESKAGKYHSSIAVHRDELFGAVCQVIDSYHGEDGSVIIQEFIDADCSGVIFSDAGNKKTLINATKGACEPVVQGLACDEYILAFNTGRKLTEKIESKTCYRLQNGSLTAFEFDQSSLDENQLKQLHAIAKSIQKDFGAPQDIEFCLKGKDLYILQTRPITQAVFKYESLTYYDNANIAESYSGLVMPLTFSFATMLYETVYNDLLNASGVSRKKLGQYKVVFQNLLGYYYGRMYYNMNHWYLMMAFLPGYERNKSNLELMISSRDTTAPETPMKPGKWFHLYYLCLVIIKLLWLPFSIKLFKRNTSKAIQKLQATVIEEADFNTCINLFHQLCKNPLRKWYITVENDTVLMTLLGVATRKGSQIYSGSSLTKKTVSAAQVEALANLSIVLFNDIMIHESLLKKDEIQFRAALNNNHQAKLEHEKYFSKYGGRFANELKLESPDLHEDFQRFSLLLNLYHQRGLSNKEHDGIGKNTILDRLIGHYAGNREEMRLLRTNMFAINRRIFKRIGHLLVEMGKLQKADDVFYLTIDEAVGSNENWTTEIVDLRRSEFDKYKFYDPPTHFFLKAGELPPVNSELINDQQILKGITGSKGSIQGRVRVFHEFMLPETIDFDILVTRNTDPGWVPLIGLSKGVIVEQGGVLSHASIVTRELGIPAAIGVKQATSILKTGDVVRINSDGTITQLTKM